MHTNWQKSKSQKRREGEKEKEKRAEMPENWTWRDWRDIQQVLDNWIIQLQMVLLGDSNTLKLVQIQTLNLIQVQRVC